MNDIVGGNAFLPVLFLVATLLSGKAVLPRAGWRFLRFRELDGGFCASASWVAGSALPRAGWRVLLPLSCSFG